MNSRLTICISLWACILSFISVAIAQAPDTVQVQTPANTKGATASTSQTSVDTAAASRVLALGIVRVNMLVPEKKGCTDNFMVYPYPVRPPTNDKKLAKLPKTMKEFRTTLFSTGYSNRVTAGKVYPTPCWRWRYILQTAIDKSKLPLPHNVVTAYGWVDDIVPYALPELRKINAAERMRIVRYNKAVEFWDLNNVDLENQATMAGRRSYEITIDKNWVGRARLPVGNWWLVGVHKLPSLVFYWQEPIKITADKVTYLNLDEWNALVVQGSW